MSNLGIGQLAKRADVAIDTIRRARALGFSLEDIRELDGRAEACPILNALSQEETS